MRKKPASMIIPCERVKLWVWIVESAAEIVGMILLERVNMWRHRYTHGFTRSWRFKNDWGNAGDTDRFETKSQVNFYLGNA